MPGTAAAWLQQQGQRQVGGHQHCCQVSRGGAQALLAVLLALQPSLSSLCWSLQHVKAQGATSSRGLAHQTEKRRRQIDEKVTSAAQQSLRYTTLLCIPQGRAAALSARTEGIRADVAATARTTATYALPRGRITGTRMAASLHRCNSSSSIIIWVLKTAGISSRESCFRRKPSVSAQVQAVYIVSYPNFD